MIYFLTPGNGCGSHLLRKFEHIRYVGSMPACLHSRTNEETQFLCLTGFLSTVYITGDLKYKSTLPDLVFSERAGSIQVAVEIPPGRQAMVGKP